MSRLLALQSPPANHSREYSEGNGDFSTPSPTPAKRVHQPTILAPDSSPLRAMAGPEGSSVSRMAKAMGSGQFQRTDFQRSPTRSTSPQETRKRPGQGRLEALGRFTSAFPATSPTKKAAAADDSDGHVTSPADSSPRKKFKTDLSRFAYNGAAPSQKKDSDLSSSSGGEESDEGPAKLSGQNKRGNGVGLSEAISLDDSDAEMEDTPATSACLSPRSASRAGEAASSSQTSPGGTGHEFDVKVERIHTVHPEYSKEQIRNALKESDGLARTALIKLLRSQKTSSAPPSSSSSSTSKPAASSSSKQPVSSSLPAVHKKPSQSPGPPGPKKTISLISPAGLNSSSPIRASPVKVTTKLRPGSSSPVFVRENSSSSQNRPVQSARPAPKPRPPPPTSSAGNKSHVSISDDSELSDSDGSDSDVSDREKRDERKALQWFNSVDASQLVDIIGCNENQAETIIDLRPFKSGDDVHRKLGAKTAKGVSPRLFDNCVELMSGLQQVDSVLERCEKMGEKLSAKTKTWESVAEAASATQASGQVEGYLYGQPKGMAEGVELKSFQLRGVNWLYLLYQQKCSGILADDMGLGKTAQVIGFLNVVTQRFKAGPHLIVVPSSVLDNWMREFKTFGPHLEVVKYHGPQKERPLIQRELKQNRKNVNVVLTTYEMAAGGDRDHLFLRKYEFATCIYDEGHMLKNSRSVKFQKLVKIRADWRLLLTGTPLQNNLGELISLLKFIMPKYFSNAEEALASIFKVSQQSQLSKERVNRAKRMMQPFLLRRKKIDVLTELRPKTERIEYCDMTPVQADLYKTAFAQTKAALREQQQQANGNAKEAATEKAKLGVLMALRKAANHPLLFRRLYDDKKIVALAKDYIKHEDHASESLQEKIEDFMINCDAELSMYVAAPNRYCQKHVVEDKEWLDSGKIRALERVIKEAQAKGERVLVFSQFVQTLEIICRALEVLDIPYRGFTGSTQVVDRQVIVDDFTNDDSIPVFLLSTKAGGVGINLTAANWVVLFDQDFNPQNDRQAADRCYRIGQEREVTIVRLISKGTIDEHIWNLGQSKLKLADRVEGVDEDEEGQDDEKTTKLVEQSLLAKLVDEDEDEGGSEAEKGKGKDSETEKPSPDGNA